MLDKLKAKGLCATTNRRIDLKHLLSAERAARGSFYATRVGFVAINSKGQRIGRAHNGFPPGITETRDRWSKTQKDFFHLHAECAGVFHAARMGYATKGATAYVTHPPCPGCMHMLIESGFARIVFSEEALLERPDWREDMVKSFALAHQHKMQIAIYRDKERSLKNADITRTELDLKVVYDGLVPEARWSSKDKSLISAATKPESAAWVENPVIKAILGAAAQGIALNKRGLIMDYLPECRVATAAVQAGISAIYVMNHVVDKTDSRWAAEEETRVARMILEEDAKIPVRLLGAPEKNMPICLDATREGVKVENLNLIRINA